MRNIFSELAYDITQLIKGSGRVILMYDEDGNRTYDQRNASKIFAYPDKMMIILTDDGIDSSVDIALSQNTDVIELQDFIDSLRHLCTNYNVLFNIQKYGKEIEPKDFANFGNNSSSDLNECLEFFNKNRIVNELFKDESNVEIKKINDEMYQFTIDSEEYIVELDGYGINFENSSSGYNPTNKNKNQFLILNTVIKCIDLIFQNTSRSYYYFSGEISNGLSKLYKTMFNKLKNDVKKLGYVPIFTNIYYYDQFGNIWSDKDIHSSYFYFINPNTILGEKMIEKAKEQNLPFVENL